MKIRIPLFAVLFGIVLCIGCAQKVTGPLPLTAADVTGTWIFSAERSILTMSQNGTSVPGADSSQSFSDKRDSLILTSQMRYRIHTGNFFFPSIDAMSDSGSWTISDNTITLSSSLPDKSAILTVSISGSNAQFSNVMSFTLNGFTSRIESILSASKQ